MVACQHKCIHAELIPASYLRVLNGSVCKMIITIAAYVVYRFVCLCLQVISAKDSEQVAVLKEGDMFGEVCLVN